MGKYLMLVTSNAHDGRDDDYNEWYDGTHLADVCALPGVTSGRRYAAIPQSPNAPPTRYLAAYEIETEDPTAVLAEMMRRGQAGEMALSDSLDMNSVQLWLYEQS